MKGYQKRFHDSDEYVSTIHHGADRADKALFQDDFRTGHVSVGYCADRATLYARVGSVEKSHMVAIVLNEDDVIDLLVGIRTNKLVEEEKMKRA